MAVYRTYIRYFLSVDRTGSLTIFLPYTDAIEHDESIAQERIKYTDGKGKVNWMVTMEEEE